MTRQTIYRATPEFIELIAEELVELWRQCAKRSANESLDYLFSCIRAFANGARPQQHDDITAVVLKVL